MESQSKVQINSQCPAIWEEKKFCDARTSIVTVCETNDDIQSLQHKLIEARVHIQELPRILDAILNSNAWRASEFPRRFFYSLKGLFRSGLLIPDGQLPVRQPETFAQRAFGQVQLASTPTPISDLPATSFALSGGFQSTVETIPGNDLSAQCVLFIDALIPDVTRDSGSCRILAVMTAVAAIGFKVEFAADSEVAEFSSVMQLEKLGIKVILGRDAISDRIICHADCYHLFFVSRPDQAAFYLPILRYYAPEALAIYDTVDLYSLRYCRASRLPDISDAERQGYQELFQHYSHLERYLASAADRVVVVTDDERVVVEAISGSSPVFVLPNIHYVKARESIADFFDRSNIMFVGGFSHAPNVDAVIYFVKNIMPLLTLRITNLIFTVVGSGMPDSIRELASPSILPLGFVEDLSDLYRSIRVVVAPLRYGAGLKGKVGESMSFGVPVVGTPLAFEGFGIQAGKHALVADNPQEFADAVVNVYNNQALWQQISLEAHNLIDEKFSQKAVSSRINEVFSIPAKS
jgi:glycosyltransferase involved in cell wall biosynthesis